MSLPVSLGVVIAPAPPSLPSRTVRIITRRPSLAESIARHAVALGLEVLPADPEAVDGDIVVVDASTRPTTLGSLLASAEAGHAALVVIATSADVESRALQVLLPEKQVVLKPVHGSRCTRHSPRRWGSQAPVVHEAASARESGPVQAHVLLVEDEAVNAAVAEGYLEALGCTVDVGDERRRGRRLRRRRALRSGPHGLSMPDMDGFATTALIRRHETGAHAPRGRGRIPIVALTAHDAGRYREKCLAADIDDIMSNPYTLEDVGVCCGVGCRADGGCGGCVAGGAASRVRPRRHRVASVDGTAVAALQQLGAGKQADLYAKLVGLFGPKSTQASGELRAALESDVFGRRGRLPQARVGGRQCRRARVRATNQGARAARARG